MSFYKEEILINSRMRGFLIVFFMIFTFIFILIELRNGRYWQSDFEVYYKSAKRALLGENLYRPDEDGFYRFKYAPFSAYLFIPFSFFSFENAKIIYSFFLSLLMCFNYFLCYSLSKDFLILHLKKVKNINLYLISVFFISLLPLAVFFVRELHLGQVNIILLFLYLYSFYLLKNRKYISLLFLALSAFIKPYFFIFLVYFAYEKQIKNVFLSLLFLLIISISSLLTYSYNNLINQYYLWFNELKIELIRESALGNDSNISIFSLFDKYISFSFFDSLVLKKISIVLICILFVIYFLKKTSAFLSKESKLFYDFSLLCIFISLLTSNGKNVYIILLPVYFILASKLDLKNYIQLFLFIVASVFIGLDFGDGGIYTKWIRIYHLLPVSAIILLFLLLLSIKKVNLQER